MPDTIYLRALAHLSRDAVERFGESVHAFGTTRKDGEEWETKGRWYRRQAGKTTRITKKGGEAVGKGSGKKAAAKPAAGKAPTKPPAGDPARKASKARKALDDDAKTRERIKQVEAELKVDGMSLNKIEQQDGSTDYSLGGNLLFTTLGPKKVAELEAEAAAGAAPAPAASPPAPPASTVRPPGTPPPGLKSRQGAKPPANNDFLKPPGEFQAVPASAPPPPPPPAPTPAETKAIDTAKAEDTQKYGPKAAGILHAAATAVRWLLAGVGAAGGAAIGAAAGFGLSGGNPLGAIAGGVAGGVAGLRSLTPPRNLTRRGGVQVAARQVARAVAPKVAAAVAVPDYLLDQAMGGVGGATPPAVAADEAREWLATSEAAKRKARLRAKQAADQERATAFAESSLPPDAVQIIKARLKQIALDNGVTLPEIPDEVIAAALRMAEKDAGQVATAMSEIRRMRQSYGRLSSLRFAHA